MIRIKDWSGDDCEEKRKGRRKGFGYRSEIFGDGGEEGLACVVGLGLLGLNMQARELSSALWNET